MLWYCGEATVWFILFPLRNKSARGQKVIFTRHSVSDYFYLTESIHKVVLPKSIPAQIHQLILYTRNNKEYVDEFVRELTCAERLYQH